MQLPNDGGLYLTRHKISDRWRGRAALQVECASHRKWKRGAACGSLHRLDRCARHLVEEFAAISSLLCNCFPQKGQNMTA
jgi:hypothetical protein